MAEEDERIKRRANFSTRHYRSTVDQEARDGGENMWIRFRMSVRNITYRFSNNDHPMPVFEIELHDLWYLLTEAAKITPSGFDDAAADRLVSQVIIARELGHLCRVVSSPNNSNDGDASQAQQRYKLAYATFSDGARMWTDLPFLAADLQATWTNSVTTMSRTERENLAGFTARLTASGVCTSQVTSCALVLFREALETPRRILGSDESAVKDQASEVALADYLPAVLAWISPAGSYQILTLCARDHDPASNDDATDVECSAVGSLLATNEPQCQSGFSMLRWNFWKARLLGIEQTAGDEEVADQARKCAGMLRRWEEITGGSSHDPRVAREAFFNRRLPSF